jgi:hypothetical protein
MAKAGPTPGPKIRDTMRQILKRLSKSIGYCRGYAVSRGLAMRMTYLIAALVVAGCATPPSYSSYDPPAIAVAQGDAHAHYKLGVTYYEGQDWAMYETGQGQPQDDADAVKWCRLAAVQGDASAQVNLGYMYDKGQGVPRDYVKAHKWYTLAASRFVASEREPRHEAVENLDHIAAKMTPTQIAEAAKLAANGRRIYAPLLVGCCACRRHEPCQIGRSE